MAKTAVITLQAVWDCRWSRLATPITLETDHWLCVRDNDRRPTNAHECETCPHWEMKGPESADATEAAAPVETEIHLAPRGPAIVSALRVTLALNAVVLFVWGFTLLTSPLYIPITVAMWLCAAALVGIAAFAPCETHPATP
jgi:hypothetical protein